MSKQSDAKMVQGYQAKPTWPECSNCQHFTSEIVDMVTWTKETKLRCSLGDFKVAKCGTCKLHQPAAQ
jgi:hypothetical protein